MSCGVGCRRGSSLAWLWLCCRPAATAPIDPLAWEPPCAAGVALRKKAKKKKKERNILASCFGRIYLSVAENLIEKPGL